jgi:2-polyprenyl-3-methyl-5-hydroxy-6-metoxy-1,4-benzoquinol methylase
MDCCHCEGIEIQFDRRKAAKKLRRYRQKGPQKTTRLLVEALEREGIQGLSLLDVGGGIGAIQHEMLARGVGTAVNYEASSAYIEACREEAQRRGWGGAVRHVRGDFAQMEAQVPEADIVTLERVICCYPDMPGLVEQSCRKAKKLLGLVYPHEAWWVKLGMATIHNLKFKLKSSPFRVFLHPTREIERLVEAHGFERRFYHKSGSWLVAVFAR